MNQSNRSVIRESEHWNATRDLQMKRNCVQILRLDVHGLLHLSKQMIQLCKKIMKLWLEVEGKQHSRTEHTCVVKAVNSATPLVADRPSEQATLLHLVTEELRNAAKSQERHQILKSEEKVAVHWHCITSRSCE